MPLLTTAESVTLLTIGEGASETENEVDDGAGIATHLRRHGIVPTVRTYSMGELSPANVLLSSAVDEEIDLIVMGFYGHSRLRQLAFGGVSREMLGHMTAPLFVSH